MFTGLNERHAMGRLVQVGPYQGFPGFDAAIVEIQWLQHTSSLLRDLNLGHCGRCHGQGRLKSYDHFTPERPRKD